MLCRLRCEVSQTTVRLLVLSLSRVDCFLSIAPVVGLNTVTASAATCFCALRDRLVSVLSRDRLSSPRPFCPILQFAMHVPTPLSPSPSLPCCPAPIRSWSPSSCCSTTGRCGVPSFRVWLCLVYAFFPLVSQRGARVRVLLLALVFGSLLLHVVLSLETKE